MNLLRHERVAVYHLKCGHTAPAPDPSPDNGDRELHPDGVTCPTCGRLDKHVDAYDGTGAG
jgi:hypothetical protein